MIKTLVLKERVILVNLKKENIFLIKENMKLYR